jgi:flagellar protein FliO/FliZ
MGAAATSIDWLRVSASMLLVLGLLGALLWMLKRMKNLQLQHKGPPMLEVLETMSLGPRQKMALVRVGAHLVLVGVTATQFTALGSWDEPAPQQEALREN